MKKVILIVLVITLALLLSFTENPSLQQTSGLSPKGLYAGGLLVKESGSYSKISNYSMKVNFDPAEKYITVEEEILWRNLTKFSTGEIQFHFYPNAYKSNNTIFAQSYYLPPEARTEVEVKTVSVDGMPSEFIYFQPETKNPNDSTAAKIVLGKTVAPSDSVKIKIEYRMKIPRSVKRMGYATGRNFFFVSQWFPKVGVFEEGKWVCSQYYPHLNFYSDFGDYDIRITTPSGYTVGATGVEASKEEKDGKNNYRFVQKGVHDFVWFATDEILHREKIYKRKDGSEILIKAYVQPEKKKYFDRYLAAVENSLRYFEERIGVYPYQAVTLVDVPRTCAAGGMEYPTLFTVSADMFSPVETHQPEGVAIHEFSHQFFYGLLANNEVYDAWLDEGFTTYITEKILYEYYGKEIVSFPFAGYIPMHGMNLLSIGEIPVIYTVTNFNSEEGAGCLPGYYKNLTIGCIADTSYKLPDRSSYIANAYYKPALVLLTLENYLGHDKMNSILKDYFNTYKFKHPTTVGFLSVVQKNCSEDMSWFFRHFIEGSYSFDYKINSIIKKGNGNYEVLAERAGDGVFKNDLAFYTDKDTLYRKWDGKERWKIFYFHTNNEVIGAEIDPMRKNLLDLNFANNSLAVKKKLSAPIILSLRWFFWVQNALMTMGGIG